MAGKKLVVAQSGGPSAVINSTLAGIIAESYGSGHIDEVLGIQDGLEGLFDNKVVNLSDFSEMQLARLRQTPGAILGSVRSDMRGEDFHKAVDLLKELGVDYFLYIGGNGTMYATHLIFEAAEKKGVDLVVGGVPKTVDNDIVGIDHTPGFGSAAKYVARAVKDLSLDLQAMKTFEQVRIVETMGRNVGWLAAASGLARENDKQAPHLIYIPEHPFDEEDFLNRLKNIVADQGYAVAVIGEGIRDRQGNTVGQSAFAEKIGKNQTYGGGSEYLAELVTERLGLRSRSQSLGMAQRSFAGYRSEVDEGEAYEIGRAAVNSLIDGLNGCMTTLSGSIPLIEVGGKEDAVPAHFYNNNTKQVTAEYISWLKPLVGSWEQNYLLIEELPKYYKS